MTVCSEIWLTYQNRVRGRLRRAFHAVAPNRQTAANRSPCLPNFGWDLEANQYRRDRMSCGMATAFVDQPWVPSGRVRASSNWPIPLVGPNQIRMADAKCQCQLVDRDDGRIPASLVQSADILLTEAGISASCSCVRRFFCLISPRSVGPIGACPCARGLP